MSSTETIHVGRHHVRPAETDSYLFECEICRERRRLPSHFEGVRCLRDDGESP